MANKNLFKSQVSNKNVIKPTNTVNNAGGVAYTLSDKAALAQLAMTGCFNGTFYVSAEDQLKNVTTLANKIVQKEPEFIARLAIYARQNGLMKDMPAFLAAVLASKDSALLEAVFDRVIDSPKMLRNFVQILRSGSVGRKSFGTRIKRLIQGYLEGMSDEQLFKADVGNNPSLQDIVKMVHPRPKNKNRSALYGYLLGKEYSKKDLLPLAQAFEEFKKDLTKDIPDVPFQMLTALPLTDAHWIEIAKNLTWRQAKINLNTLHRHSALANREVLDSVVAKLQNPEQVKRAKALPFELFSAYKHISSEIPSSVSVALQKAAEVALENIPEFKGKVYVMVDVSGSMSSAAVTGDRGKQSSVIRAVDAAALIASAVLRKNPNAEVIPFDTQVHKARLNPMDSIMTNAEKLARFGGGGTYCAKPLEELNAKRAEGDLVIYVSDNESWVDSPPPGALYGSYARGTATMQAWNQFKARPKNRNAKLVCIDLTPNGTTQANDREDILNVGGFSDTVFDVIAKFVELGNNKDLWIKTIESVKI